MRTPAESVSLAITVLNEATSLDAWFSSVATQHRLPDEVVICDGGSTDGTVEVIEQWRLRIPVAIKLIEAPGANISRGRNLAIQAASYELVAITDGGTTLSPGWLAALVDASGAADVVSGFFEPSGATAFERSLATLITPVREEIQPSTFLPSSRSLLVRKAAWAEVQGYPEWLDYCEDLVFDIALKRAGMRFAFAPDAIVTWAARPDLRSYARQYYRYARGDGKALLWTRRHVVRYGAYLVGLMLAVASLRSTPARIALLLGYGASTFRFYRRALLAPGLSGRTRLRAILMVPVVAVIGDIAKIAGYPAGLRWRRYNATGAGVDQ